MPSDNRMLQYPHVGAIEIYIEKCDNGGLKIGPSLQVKIASTRDRRRHQDCLNHRAAKAAA